ncbi:MAG: glycosyltransferase family 4 protein [Nanoarchaeota archaeon]|nr:glycosyltransferase family 4 protein [Nanoarchaeota archaeon]
MDLLLEVRIGIVIKRIGGEDGVALEAEKWIEVLERMSHEVFLLSGEFEKNILDEQHQEIMKEFSLLSKENWWEQEKAFISPDENSIEIVNHIEEKSEKIAEKIIEWIGRNNIDLFITENASALPVNLSMSFGIKKAVERTGIRTITHDHDFYWERGERYLSSHEAVNEIVRESIPLKLPNVVNVVINYSAQKILQEKYNLSETVVIPNVMDFNKKVNDKCIREFPDTFGLDRGDIILLQPTRVVRRKGIETAIELVHKLNDKKIKLFITGNDKDENNGSRSYYKKLRYLIRKFKLEKQVIFAGRKIKGFSLFDVYACANSCTYFSDYEGFGNAFIEAVFAKKPIFVNNYKPIFWSGIGSKGFKIVMIEDNILTDEAVEKIKKVIYNGALRREIGEHNFEIGKKYFSYEVLREKLEEVFDMLRDKDEQAAPQLTPQNP